MWNINQPIAKTTSFFIALNLLKWRNFNSNSTSCDYTQCDLGSDGKLTNQRGLYIRCTVSNQRRKRVPPRPFSFCCIEYHRHLFLKHGNTDLAVIFESTNTTGNVYFLTANSKFTFGKLGQCWHYSLPVVCMRWKCAFTFDKF